MQPSRRRFRYDTSRDGGHGWADIAYWEWRPEEGRGVMVMLDGKEEILDGWNLSMAEKWGKDGLWLELPIWPECFEEGL